MKSNRTYSVNAVSRILLGLLAVFYVAIFAVEAIHSHENNVETSSPVGVNSGSDAIDCKICAYFAHHKNKEAAISDFSSLSPIVFEAITLSDNEVAKRYQTDTPDFTSRGPPYLYLYLLVLTDPIQLVSS